MSRRCSEGTLCEAVVLLKQMSLELQLNFMLNQVITCLSSLLLVWPHQVLQKLNQQEATLPPSKRRAGEKMKMRERIVFCWFNSLKLFIRRSEGNQGTHNRGSGAAGPEHRNEGRKGLLLHWLSPGKTVRGLQSEQYLSLELMDIKRLQFPTAGPLFPFIFFF